MYIIIEDVEKRVPYQCHLLMLTQFKQGEIYEMITRSCLCEPEIGYMEFTRDPHYSPVMSHVGFKTSLLI